VVAIEESKDLGCVKVGELQASLEAHEQIMNERTSDRRNDQALEAHISKNNAENSKGKKNKGKKSHHKNDGASSSKNQDQAESSSQNNKSSNPKKKFNKSKVQGYNCNKFGHFADECYSNKKQQRRSNNEDSDSDAVLLMATTNSELGNSETWYLNSGCSNHMTSHREWLVDFDGSKKSKVRLADNRTVPAEGVGNVVIKTKEGKQGVISDVLFVPNIKSNLLSIGQLLEKGLSMQMKDEEHA
jgi:hypothetical protein